MWQPLTGQSTSQHWSTSQLWARAVNVGQTGYFYTIFGRWFLYRTLNGLERKGSSGGNSLPTRLFLEISQNHKL